MKKLGTKIGAAGPIRDERRIGRILDQLHLPIHT
jgi:hypothetical protein